MTIVNYMITFYHQNGDVNDQLRTILGDSQA